MENDQSRLSQAIRLLIAILGKKKIIFNKYIANVKELTLYTEISYSVMHRKLKQNFENKILIVKSVFQIVLLYSQYIAEIKRL